MTGTPVRDTSNATEDSVVWMFETRTARRGRFATVRAVAASDRFHDDGPPSVSGRSRAVGSLNQGTAVHSHALYSASVDVLSTGFAPPLHFQDESACRSSTTTGSYDNPCTVGELRTR